MHRTLPAALLAAALVGCRTPDPEPPGRSSTLVSSSNGAALYAVNVDEGTVSRLSLEGLEVARIPVGSEPTRLTRASGRVWVTLRGERSVVALDEEGRTLIEAARTEVGAEPYGIVATADGSRVYVAVSLEDRVLELHGGTLEVLRKWTVLDEPRWLALDRPETALFVASARDGRFTRIDLETGETRDIELPETGPAGLDFGDGPFDVTITGDPAVSADGDAIGVPVVYADTITPVDLEDTGADATTASGTEGEGGGGGGYASEGTVLGRMNPALVLLPIDGDGTLADDEAKPVFLGIDPRGPAIRSYPNAVAADPDGRYFVVTMEASDAALVVDTEPFRGQGKDPERRAEIDFAGRRPSTAGFWDRPVTAIDTGRGARGVAFAGTQVFVHSFLDRSIGWLDWDDAVEVNRHVARVRKAKMEDVPPPVLRVSQAIGIEESALPDAVRRGQRLFYSAVDREIVAKGGGVSCSSCHVDGRTDGRTWAFTDGPRQTPSLAGGASETAPFTWDGTVASVAEEADLTSTLRMGGKGLDDDALADLAAFVDWTRAPDVPGADPALVAEGGAIFRREDVGCATCHAGPRFTDGLNHAVVGRPTNTPTLTGIAATAPYLHDGSARTLRDVLVWARSGAMGDTSMLSEHELDALEAFVSSL